MSRPRVVIVGCGFGGLEAAKALRDAPVDVTIIDRQNHHLFQPLLYQVATAGLSAPAIAEPIRRLFRHQRNATVFLGEVVDIEVGTGGAPSEAATGNAPGRMQTESAPGRVQIESAPGRVRMRDGSQVPYDHLIVAAGATTSYFGHDDWAQHAPGLKTLVDAFDLRRRLLVAYEHAEVLPREASEDERRALLTSVVIGAGPTGVELAGTMIEIAHHSLKGEFRRSRPDEARVILVEGGPRVLPALDASLGQRALQQLRDLGVEVMLDSRVSQIDADGVTVQQGERVLRLRAATVVWAAGVRASPLGEVLARAFGAELDRAGRVKVTADLSLPGHPHISVVGDMAMALSHHPGRPPAPVPGVSPGAKQAGRCAARNLLRRLQGRPTQPFRYINYGDLATIGRHAAVADVPLPGLGSWRFGGLGAWLFWLFVHIYFLIDFRSRLVVMIEWGWAYFTFDRSARIVASVEPPAPSRPLAEPSVAPVVPPR